MRLALTEFQEVAQGGDGTRRTRAWKLFILLPRLLLFRPARGGLIAKSRLLARFSEFSKGHWLRAEIAPKLDDTETVEWSEVDEDWAETTSIPEDEVVAPVRAFEVRQAFRVLDTVDVETILEQRAAVMKTVPTFLRGPFRNALTVALEEILATPDTARRERGWKLLMLLPRMLLHRPPGGGLIAKDKLEARFHAFGRGDWGQLLDASRKCDEKAAQSRRRGRRRTVSDDVEKRTLRAELLVQVGELSAARQALEGAALAPGNQATLDALTDATRRPPHLRPTFNKNLRSSRRGAAGGPSGMTTEHLRPLLDERRALHLFFLVARKLARADVPDAIVDLIRVGRLTSLTKPDGGVRGIVAGDVVRRLVARTISQQLGPEVEQATSPYQYAMSTRAGCECIAHALQGLTELDPHATVTSVDGISAFDMISRQ